MIDISNLEPFLTFDVRNDIIEHMRDEAPKECCGSITLSDGMYTYHRHENTHADPENHFSFAKTVSAKISRSKSVVAYVHSHPKGQIEPSKHDMLVQMRVKKPSVIATIEPNSGILSIASFGDHLLDAPLEGRPFVYGVFDCLEAVRSEAWQREGRLMPAVARHNNWWLRDTDVETSDRNMYEDNFAKYGYVEYPPNLEDPTSELHPQAGDVILMQIGPSDVCNHAGVYIGNNLMYQHRAGRQSGNTPVGYMLHTGTVRKWVRYQGDKA